MKENKRVFSRRRTVLTVLGLVVTVAVIVGLAFGYTTLRTLWLEQCVITDMERQVSISSGKMVKADVLAEFFGLKPGANLALIDFRARRTEALKRIPNLRSLSVSRHLPDRISIVAEERKPIARMSYRNWKKITGRVVDGDGIVFDCIPGTSMLPIIRENGAPGTPRGHRVEGHALAALQLVEMCREPEFQSLGLLDISLEKADYLVATLGTYSKAKIAWEGMSAETAEARASLRRQLTHLVQAINSRIGDGIVSWDATDYSKPGRVYAK